MANKECYRAAFKSNKLDVLVYERLIEMLTQCGVPKENKPLIDRLIKEQKRLKKLIEQSTNDAEKQYLTNRLERNKAEDKRAIASLEGHLSIHIESFNYEVEAYPFYEKLGEGQSVLKRRTWKEIAKEKPCLGAVIHKGTLPDGAIFSPKTSEYGKALSKGNEIVVLVFAWLKAGKGFPTCSINSPFIEFVAMALSIGRDTALSYCKEHRVPSIKSRFGQFLMSSR
ncbi:hypothetical protein [Vibrio fluvialis]|uniref:hypothetical protein n=1 Tax=Vibrio fluvialis TaxID=676 RepID=UPI003D7D23DE